jgi:aminobenzoyl-glutamate utilization protein B
VDSPGLAGHGCGHHLLGTSAHFAAVALQAHLLASGQKARVRYYGCPAEEGGSGKTFMARAGVFDDVDVALTWHPGSFTSVFSQTTLANIQAKFIFHGKASHAAHSPHLGRSALDAVELMNVGVNYLREHMPSDARVHYAVTDSGGLSPNVVQAEALLSYVIRAPKMADMYAIADRVIKCAQGAATMTETQMHYKVVSGTSNLMSTKIVMDRFNTHLKELLPIAYTQEELAYAAKFKNLLDKGDEKRLLRCIRLSYPEKSSEEIRRMYEEPMANWHCVEVGNTASTDAGDVSWVVPGCQLHVACYPAGLPFHSWQMVAMGKSSLAKKGMKTAAKVLALTALDFLTDPAMLEQARKDFAAKLDGETYRCPLPDTLQPGDKSF